jgi:hypothetical protein
MVFLILVSSLIISQSKSLITFMSLIALKILVNWRIWVYSFPDTRHNRDFLEIAGNFTDNGMKEQKSAF